MIRVVFLPSRIPDPGVKKLPDPGSGSATLLTLVYFTAIMRILMFVENPKALSGKIRIRISNVNVNF
jgi:hypothetical protein